jgi:APA family basic amino acid/polyamine antiporter
MAQEQKLSPLTAILININVMLGSGIFLNITELAQRTHALGFVCYAIVGCLLFPLVASIAALLRNHSSGGFYAFTAHGLGPAMGFMSGWSYFVGKLASATIILHAAVTLLQQVIPGISHLSALKIDAFLIALFVLLNTLNMRTGSIIQAIFTILKLIPVLIVIALSFFYFDINNFTSAHHVWSGIPLSLPLVVYALIGFEVACSISSHIHNAKKNAPRVIFISYALAVGIIILFQLCFYGLIGPLLSTPAMNFKTAYPALFGSLFTSWGSLAHYAGALCNSAIALSALGGAYGIIFSNNWNLHTLAHHGFVLKSSWFTRLNKQDIPAGCVVA